MQQRNEFVECGLECVRPVAIYKLADFADAAGETIISQIILIRRKAHATATGCMDNGSFSSSKRLDVLIHHLDGFFFSSCMQAQGTATALLSRNVY